MEHSGIENLEHFIASHGIDNDSDDLKEIINQIVREKGIKIGQYLLIDEGYAKQKDKIEISHGDEAMDCDKIALEPVIAQFFKDNF